MAQENANAAATESTPVLWRAEAPVKTPGQTPDTTRRAVFIWMLMLLAVMGVTVSVFTWIRPAPKPLFAPVWINDYTARPLHAPPFGARDAKALIDGEFFTKGGISLKSLPDASGDTVVVYISGHAICDDQGRVLLLPADTELTTLATARPLRNVLQLLADSPARKKLLILDICWTLDDTYVGGFDDIAARIPDELAAVPDPARLVICPCAPGQTALASPDLGRSVFSYFLEDGLRGFADYDATQPERQGLVTARKLADHVQTKVAQWAHAHEARQTPMLYGDAADFPLVAIERSQPRAHPNRAEVGDDPDWLIAAWKTRERWWLEERHRPAPLLFRRLAGAVSDADRSWRNGGDGAAIKKSVAETIDRLEQQYLRVVADARPEPLSLAQALAAGRRPDAKLKPIVKDLFKNVAAARAAAPKADEGEKAAAKVIEEFIDKHKQVADFDWTWAIFDFLVDEPAPRRDIVQLGARLLATRQSATKYAEADAVHRLAKLSDRFDDAGWPAALVRKAILLTERGERAFSRWRSIAWLTGPLATAAQKRHDAELMLHARGYVALPSAEPLLSDALREIEGVLSQQDALDNAERLTQDALVVLPEYTDFIDHRPAADAFWREAAQAASELQTLLDPPDRDLPAAELSARIEEVRVKTQSLRDALGRLKQMHAPEVVEDLVARHKRPDADVKLLKALESQLTVPFHSGATRAKLWLARAALAKKLADKFFDDAAESSTPPARFEAEELQEIAEARRRRGGRAARSLALLRLTGAPSEEVTRVENQLADFVAVKDAELRGAAPEVRDGGALATALRQAWGRTSTGGTNGQTRIEQVSRGAPAWVRFGIEEEAVSKAARVAEWARERRLLSFLAGWYRYESAEPLATPFAGRAASALRDFAMPATGLTMPSAPTRIPLTPQKPSAQVNIPLRWTNLPLTTPPLRVQVVTADDDWLRVAPKVEGLDALTMAPRDQPGALEIPVQVTLKPGAELSAAARPAGFLLRFEAGGRAFHHAVELPQLPAAERLEIIVSADPKDPSVPFGDLRLRPSQERQAYFIYVNNRGKALRNLTVELRAGDRLLPGATVPIAAPPEQITRVVFGIPAAAPKDAVAPKDGPPKTPPVKEALPELTGPLLVRLLDRDRKDEQVATREIRVAMADPREYVRVPTIRFEPANEKSKNRLDVDVQAVRKLPGPPVAVELVVPKERIAGLQTVRGGIFRGELPADGALLKLFASEFEFDAFAEDTGPIYLTVDGVDRAFIFRTTFAPVGEATTPREELRPALRVSAGRFYKTNTKFEAIAEVDHPPANAQLQVSLGQVKNGVFEAEIKAPVRSAREKRIGAGVRADGGVEFDTLLRDWRVPFDAVPVRGERVVEARLVEAGVDLVPPAYTRVLFDDRVPERVAFVDLPKQAKRDVPILIKATGIDQATGIKEVAFFLGKPTADGKLPQGAVKIDATPSKTEPNVWHASMNWPGDKRGPIDVSVMFTNRLDLSAFAKASVELVDFDPDKSAPGTIEGVVVEGSRAQEGVDVVLFDAKGNKVAEQKTKAGGAFAFANLAPGVYFVRATKPTAGTPLVGNARVELAPGKSKRITIALFL